jgi:hypothetical protein
MMDHDVMLTVFSRYQPMLDEKLAAWEPPEGFEEGTPIMDIDTMWKAFHEYQPMLNEMLAEWQAAKSEGQEVRRPGPGGPVELSRFPALGHYVEPPVMVRPGDPNEVEALRVLAAASGKEVDHRLGAARLREELGLKEDEPFVEARALADPVAEDSLPRGEGSTASGAPEMNAHPGHGATNSGAGESYDPGYGATISGAPAGGVVPEGEPEAPAAPEAPPTAPPVNRDVPHVSGTGTVGSTLNCTMGNWDNMSAEPHSYAYQWQRDAVDIGATAADYVIVAGDAGHSLTCVVTATNAMGSTAAPPSNAVAVNGAATQARAPIQRPA